MNPLTTTLTTLSGLLEYPGSEFASRLAAAQSAAPLARFCTAISALTPDEREELYTGTFDVTPACVAYVSIHLFGEENFKRGEFMAGLHARYQQAGFSTMGELPDHLAVLLRFTAQVDDAERREIAEFCLLGPVGKMIAALNESNPYRALLEAVRDTLQAAYPDVKPALSPVEQMRLHGAGCATVTAGCGCGSA
ncbi:MAG: nitrate reductase molybdenum cofactor assembly chaperone, partial [Verrucomicrobia bacterium]|nr:nitrate reductase molybdenum cofactor assembly chaperone [Verrucomicrobiota bacterium]